MSGAAGYIARFVDPDGKPVEWAVSGSVRSVLAVPCDARDTRVNFGLHPLLPGPAVALLYSLAAIVGESDAGEPIVTYGRVPMDTPTLSKVREALVMLGEEHPVRSVRVSAIERLAAAVDFAAFGPPAEVAPSTFLGLPVIVSRYQPQDCIDLVDADGVTLKRLRLEARQQ